MELDIEEQGRRSLQTRSLTHAADVVGQSEEGSLVDDTLAADVHVTSRLVSVTLVWSGDGQVGVGHVQLLDPSDVFWCTGGGGSAGTGSLPPAGSGSNSMSGTAGSTNGTGNMSGNGTTMQGGANAGMQGGTGAGSTSQ